MKLFAFIITVSLMVSSAGYARICATPAEFQALNMRALQSELMVAALSCSQSRYYNWFAQTYDAQLKSYGNNIIGFFGRHGANASKGEKLLNDFITKMANTASKASLGRSQQQYCSEVASLYGALQNGKFNKVETLANRYYSGWHRIPLCESHS